MGELVSRLERIAGTTDIVAGYVWAVALIAWSVLSYFTWREKLSERSVSDARGPWRFLIDLGLPMTACGLGVWCIINGPRPDWLLLLLGSGMLWANWEFSAQWRKMRQQ